MKIQTERVCAVAGVPGSSAQNSRYDGGLRRRLDLRGLGRRLAATASEVRHNDFLLRFRVPPYELTVFADGRAIIRGTCDPAVAHSLNARYIGA